MPEKFPHDFMDSLKRGIGETGQDWIGGLCPPDVDKWINRSGPERFASIMELIEDIVAGQTVDETHDVKFNKI